METVRPSPNAEVSIYQWKDMLEHIREALARIRRFLQAHQPVAAVR